MKLSLSNWLKSTLPSHVAPLFVFVSRLGFFPGNVSPLGSYGFFSGNLPVYALIILGFDLFVGGTYRGNVFTYLGFLLYYLMGRIAKGQPKRQLFLLPISSLLFFLVSNFGVFLYWYPHTTQGLLHCYLLAIPFYTRTLLGDLLFGYSYLILKTRQSVKLVSPSC